MREFTDNTGRKWQIAMTVGDLKRVRATSSVDLMEAACGDLVDRLSSDPALLAEALFALLRPAADAAGVTAEAFDAGLAGGALDGALEALLLGLVDFFPRGPRMQAMTKILRAAEKTEEDLRQTQSLCGGPSISPPASAASPPAP